MVCLLGSSEQHYPWTVGDALVPWDERWDAPARSTLLPTAVLGRGLALGQGHFGPCQKAPDGVLGDPNGREQVVEKWL